MAFRVIHLQKCEKQSLDMYDEPTNVSKVNGQQVLKLCHPPDAFAVHVSGYIASLVAIAKVSYGRTTVRSKWDGTLLRIVVRLLKPARSVETKSFFVEYWKWQHHLQLGAVEQYGPISLILTISPYEWTWPSHPGLLA